MAIRYPFRRRKAKHRFDAWAHVEPLAFRAGLRHVRYSRELLDEQLIASFRLARQFLLRATALHDLPELRTDVRHHGEQLAIGLLDVAGKELQDGNHFTLRQHRKAERPFHTEVKGDLPPRKIRVLVYVWDPGGLATLRYASW